MAPELDARRRQADEAVRLCTLVLKNRFGAREVHVFGSLAGQSPWHSNSDIDLAVEGLAPEDYVPALSALYDLLPEGLELDLVTLEDAAAELAARIKGGATPDDPKKALEKEIADETLNLDRIVGRAGVLLQKLPPEPGFIEISAAGKLLHDFYSAVERIFERIAVRLGPGLPPGEGWHTLLLRGMESEAVGIRPAVIDHQLALRLVEYLRFRHLFRHTYGYELQWEKLRPLVEGLKEIHATLRQQLAGFLAQLANP